MITKDRAPLRELPMLVVSNLARRKESTKVVKPTQQNLRVAR